ncbi:MAG: DUF4440 domain-containing protein [Candidatus Marinimicrobia bacterium]|nr:DUF4440 domain-containing protein [Candidatus Neomarinimicrobiota bacterium]
MKWTKLLLIILLMIVGCGDSMNIEKEKKLLMDTDRAFSNLSVQKGVPAAFNQFMTDDAVIFRDKNHPFEGREQIQQLFADYPEATLTWEPYHAEVAAAGDLGYTLGKWTFTMDDETGEDHKSQGYYVSIWRKQTDGSWKYVFDTGINAPSEGDEAADENNSIVD